MLYTSQCRTERVITQLNCDNGQASVRIAITDIVCIKNKIKIYIYFILSNWSFVFIWSFVFGMLCLRICIDIGLLSMWSF